MTHLLRGKPASSSGGLSIVIVLRIPIRGRGRCPKMSGTEFRTPHGYIRETAAARVPGVGATGTRGWWSCPWPPVRDREPGCRGIVVELTELPSGSTCARALPPASPVWLGLGPVRLPGGHPPPVQRPVCCERCGQQQQRHDDGAQRGGGSRPVGDGALGRPGHDGGGLTLRRARGRARLARRSVASHWADGNAGGGQLLRSSAASISQITPNPIRSRVFGQFAYGHVAVCMSAMTHLLGGSARQRSGSRLPPLLCAYIYRVGASVPDSPGPSSIPP